MQSLSGKVALVTGGGQGLGEAICLTLAEAGAVVVAADIRKEQADRVVQAIQAIDGKAMSLHLDVSDAVQAEQAIQHTLQACGRLDVLINNAGTDRTVSIEELSVEDWDRVLSINLRGPFVLSNLAFPHMKQQGGGHIINVASTAAKRAWANAAAYHASKWGLLGFSHALHVEGRASGISVSAVIAGGMRTPFLFDRFPDLDPGVLQEPENVAKVVRFVIESPAGSVIPEVLVLPTMESSWP